MQAHFFVLEVFGNERTWTRIRNTLREVSRLYDMQIREDCQTYVDGITPLWIGYLEAPHDEGRGPDEQLVRAWEKLLGEPLC